MPGQDIRQDGTRKGLAWQERAGRSGQERSGRARPIQERIGEAGRGRESRGRRRVKMGEHG